MPTRRRHTRSGGVAPARVLVDSGAWIALVRDRDAHHAEADRMVRRAVADRVPLLTTNLIVGEVHRFLLFHMGIRPAAAFLDRLHASSRLTITYATADHHAVARRWLAKLADQVISYTDAVSFAVMEDQRCTAAMSFDHDFVIAGFRRWQPNDG